MAEASISGRSATVLKKASEIMRFGLRDVLLGVMLLIGVITCRFLVPTHSSRSPVANNAPGRPAAVDAVPAGVLLVSLVVPEASPEPQVVVPRFQYRGGSQGVGYYAAPQVAAAPRQRTVGPGARNWSTGNRVPLHRPWMSARN